MTLLSLLVMLFFGIAFFGDAPGLAAIVVLAVAAFVWSAVRRAIEQGLPQQPRIEPAPPGDLLPATLDLVQDLEALGFVALGGPHVANLKPAPIVLPFVHRERCTLAAIYELRTPQERTVLDLVTIFACGATLTTANAREAGVLPLPPQRFLQTRHGAAAATLFAAHDEGVATLRAAGRRPTSTASTTLAECLQRMLACLHDQRAGFDRAPVQMTATALVRTLFALDPFRRPLAERPALQ